MTDSGDALLGLTRQALDSIAPADAPLCLAYSGGMDSTVLLELLVRLRPGRVRALHVNHGLQNEADVWAEACVERCAALRVDCRVLAVSVPENAGNIEALARAARYSALAAELAPDELLVTAHHQQDQLETLLLALLRGSGVHGLAAMPAKGELHGMVVLRPLLDAGRDELASYATVRGLTWSEDPSNSDERFDRNYLRHRIVPVLEARWPAAAGNMARSARLAAAAMRVLDERAAEDLDGHCAANALRVAALSEPGTDRALNALRSWCRRLGLAVPSEVQARAALETLLHSRPDAEPLAAWPGVRIRRYRESLYAYSEDSDPGATDASAVLGWADAAGGQVLDLGPVRGSLCLVGTDGAGLARTALGDAVEIRFRQGGEQLRVRAGGPGRDLKKLLQEDGVLPWMRTNIPLIYVDDALAAVGDRWLNHDHPAVVAGDGVRPDWRGHSLFCSPF